MENEKQEKTNKRAALLEVALVLFSQRGYTGTSVQEIVNLAGVTKPTLYYFFKNKQGIYAALWDEYFVPFNESLQEKCNYIPSPKEYEKDVFGQLCDIAQLYYAFCKKNPVFYRLMLSLQFSPEDAEGISTIQQLYEKNYTQITAFFNKASKTHGNLKGKTSLLARIFIADVYAGIEADIPVNAIVKLFMHGIY
ncbi:MAG: hypothetical protein BKP49_07735 [Treponema sp. CETP13]|nr:MAG: hypothetical protein BKP49_07735 [Treponema sp. CETP13]